MLTIALVVTFAFVVLRLSGDPALIIMGPEAPPEVIAAFRKAWGLDDPIWMQYFDYFGAIAKGELGRSMRDGRPAIELVAGAHPRDPGADDPGAAAQARDRHPGRHLCGAASRQPDRPRGDDRRPWPGFTVPSFVLGLLLVLIFAVQLGWLPSGGQDSLAARHPADRHARHRRGGGACALHAQRDAGGAGPALHPHGVGQGRAVARGGPVARAAQCRDPDRDDHRLHGRHADRRRRRRRKRVLLARGRAAAGRRGRQPRSCGGAMHPAAGRGDDGRHRT